MPQSEQKRHWYQFSLRTLLIIVMVAAGLAGAWHVVIEPYFLRRSDWRAIFKPGDPLVDLSNQKRDYPEQRAFCELCAKLRIGMREQEVNAIMVGYRPKRENREGLRPGYYCNVYTKREEEYVPKLEVYFDDKHIAMIAYAIDDVLR
jgi:hypothetical protein